MKTFLVLLFALLLAAAAFFYLYHEFAPGLLKESPLGPEVESTVLYIWRDEQGNVMATSKPPQKASLMKRKNIVMI